MKKLVGYIISIAGIFVMIAGFGTLDIAFLNSFAGKYVMIAGIILIILGVVFSLADKSSSKKGKNKVEQEKEEVPIYSGEGKSRKIVGYQKA